MTELEGKIRVGFFSQDGSWLGGRTYLMNLFQAIRSLPKSRVVPVLIKGEASPDPGSDFAGVTVVSTPLLDRMSPLWIGERIISMASGREWLLERLLIKQGIEVLSHSGYLGKNSSVAAISWIPDFQFLHLPEFFSKNEIKSRRTRYAAMCEKSDRVFVSSESVRKDLCGFQPQYAAKAAILRFVASVIPESQSSSISNLRQRYRIPDRYFLLPNQFWAHKNHRVVIAALKLLKQAGTSIPVYATGRTEDPRNPSFFSSLMDYADQCDVKDLFRVLGVIPFADLAGLMRNSVALMNPSKFEGWSTSVEESKSLGKAIILSDIDVHLEQAPRLGTYFSPTDAESLAKAMLSVWQRYDSIVDLENQRRAGHEYPARQLEFARAFEEIVLSTRYA